MQIIHTFQCSTHPGLFGYTADHSGKALPRGQGWEEWTYYMKIAMVAGDTNAAVNVTEMLSAIERTGCYLSNSGSQVTP